MKPVRGSGRDSSEGPTRKNASKSNETTQKQAVDKQDAEHSTGNEDKSPGPKKSQKGKGKASAKAPENVQPISCSSIFAMENIMDWSILATLPLRRTDKKETQEHLNILKKRFLSHCAELKVPAGKRKKWDYSSYHHQEESKRSAIKKKSLSSLENGLVTVVKTLESMEEESESLKRGCSVLRERVEDEEEKAKEILQIKECTVLNLPSLPTQRDNTSSEAQG